MKMFRVLNHARKGQHAKLASNDRGPRGEKGRRQVERENGEKPIRVQPHDIVDALTRRKGEVFMIRCWHRLERHTDRCKILDRRTIWSEGIEQSDERCALFSNVDSSPWSIFNTFSHWSRDKWAISSIIALVANLGWCRLQTNRPLLEHSRN